MRRYIAALLVVVGSLAAIGVTYRVADANQSRECPRITKNGSTQQGMLSNLSRVQLVSCLRQFASDPEWTEGNRFTASILLSLAIGYSPEQITLAIVFGEFHPWGIIYCTTLQPASDCEEPEDDLARPANKPHTGIFPDLRGRFVPEAASGTSAPTTTSTTAPAATAAQPLTATGEMLYALSEDGEMEENEIMLTINPDGSVEGGFTLVFTFNGPGQFTLDGSGTDSQTCRLRGTWEVDRVEFTFDPTSGEISGVTESLYTVDPISDYCEEVGATGGEQTIDMAISAALEGDQINGVFIFETGEVEFTAAIDR